MNKPTNQSVTQGKYDSSLAVDDNRNTNFTLGSCTHTEKVLKPWWIIDLQAEYFVAAVTLYNRDDEFCKSVKSA